jgi:hypothetical protein
VLILIAFRIFVCVLSEYAAEKDFREEFCMRLTPKGGESLFPPPTGVVCNMMPIIYGQHDSIPDEFRGYAAPNHFVYFSTHALACKLLFIFLSFFTVFLFYLT